MRILAHTKHIQMATPVVATKVLVPQGLQRVLARLHQARLLVLLDQAKKVLNEHVHHLRAVRQVHRAQVVPELT